MKSLKYLEWIRVKPCCVCGNLSKPHHLKRIGMGRNRKKDLVEHYTAVPLCRSHHEQAHRSKDYEKRFWKMPIINIVEGEKMDWDVNLLKVATLLLAEWTWSEFSGKRGYYW